MCESVKSVRLKRTPESARWETMMCTALLALASHSALYMPGASEARQRSWVLLNNGGGGLRREGWWKLQGKDISVYCHSNSDASFLDDDKLRGLRKSLCSDISHISSWMFYILMMGKSLPFAVENSDLKWKQVGILPLWSNTSPDFSSWRNILIMRKVNMIGHEMQGIWEVGRIPWRKGRLDFQHQEFRFETWQHCVSPGAGGRGMSQ